MGFGHRVYKTDDPRSVLLKSVARRLGGPMADFAVQVEQTVVDVLAETFAAIRPAATLVAVAALIEPSLAVEIEVDAVRDPG